MAGEQGHAEAQFNLGHYYQNGFGVPKDDAEAVKWIRQAAEQGEGYALCDLGICYQKGSGVPRDIPEAYKLYKLAMKFNSLKAGAFFKITVGRMTAEEITEGERRFREFCLENDLDWTT